MADHTVPCAEGDWPGCIPSCGADAAPIVTDEIRDEINGAEFWQWRAWVEDLLPEVDRLRAENALLRGDNATLGSTVTELRVQLREALGDPT